MSCKHHPIVVERYRGSLKDLAKDIANLRYDAQVEFLNNLDNEIMQFYFKDKKAGKHQLALAGKKTADKIKEAAKWANRCWAISKKYMLV